MRSAYMSYSYPKIVSIVIFLINDVIYINYEYH